MVTRSANPAFVYPTFPKVDLVDDYHGVKIADPFRGLEDLDSEPTRAWVRAQNEVTFKFLESIPERMRIRERLTRLWDYEKYTAPWREGGRYFWFKNDGLQPQSVLYTATRLDGAPTVLLDPNKLSADGTVALAGLAVSRDGRLLAYGLATAGSDWNEWKVREIATGKDLDDSVRWVKFSGASFTADGKGFFYSRYDEPKAGDALEETNYFQKLYYHRIGRPQSEDELVYERKDQKEWGFDGTVTEDGRYLIVTVWKGTDAKNLVFYRELKGKGSGSGAPIVPLVDSFDAEYSFLGNDGPVFYFKTNRDAPRGRIVAVDTRKAGRAKSDPWREIVPQTAETLNQAGMVSGYFVAQYLKDAKSLVRIHTVGGKIEREVELPGIGTAAGFVGRRDSAETFFTFGSFTVPGAVYRYDARTGARSLFKSPKVDFDPAGYETRQVFYKSKDGTTVPMFLTHRKGLALDGSNPTYLYGYGGFNNPITPAFSPSALVWMEMGGIYAVANLRGGGEYGEEWHQAGTKKKKQNVFDDFIAAAEWLIANRYTSSGKIGIGGASNGGLLVGACLTQRPDLFGAALPAVGVLDMLRFHKFTIGWAWVDDYGSSDDPEMFPVLRAYSPLHNLKKGTRYPPTLITTADHDDRVVPSHSFKFAAALQEAQGGDAPVMIRIETRAGHGAGKPTAKVIEEAADRWAFLVKALAIQVPAQDG